MPFKIVRNDITRMDTEAIVNTANEFVAVGSGCDYAIYQAAGYDRLLQYRKDHIGEVEEGEVFITPGFDLPARYIIHAVSPRYKEGNSSEEEKLRSCYRKSLALAHELGIRSIAFPLISTGGFGYPKEEGIRIAVDEIHAFLLKSDMMISLVVFGPEATGLGEKIYPGLESYIDSHYVENKEREEYRHQIYTGIPRDSAECQAASVPERGRKGRTFPGQRGNRRLFRRRKEEKEKYNYNSEENISSEEMDEFPVTGASYPSMGPVQAEDLPEEDYDGFPTEDLSTEDYDGFLGDLESKLEERLRHRSDTFSEYLLYLIQEKGMSNAEVWKSAIVDKKVFSKIKNNPDYHPNKKTALCLCVGARLNLDETRDLLARAGYALSPCDMTDIIFSYFIEKEIFDMIELDIQLEEHGLPCIIS